MCQDVDAAQGIHRLPPKLVNPLRIGDVYGNGGGGHPFAHFATDFIHTLLRETMTNAAMAVLPASLIDTAIALMGSTSY